MSVGKKWVRVERKEGLVLDKWKTSLKLSDRKTD